MGDRFVVLRKRCGISVMRPSKERFASVGPSPTPVAVTDVRGRTPGPRVTRRPLLQRLARVQHPRDATVQAGGIESGILVDFVRFAGERETIHAEDAIFVIAGQQERV